MTLPSANQSMHLMLRGFLPLQHSTPLCTRNICALHTSFALFQCPVTARLGGVPTRPQFVLTYFVRSDAGASRDAYANTSTRQPSAAIFSSRFFRID